MKIGSAKQVQKLFSPSSSLAYLIFWLGAGAFTGKYQPCDILQDDPLGNALADDDLYDCVMSSACLAAASPDIKSYETAVRNLVSFAKPGAPVVIGDIIGSTYYQV